MRDRDDAKARQRIIERNRQRGPALRVERNPSSPQQQRIEKLARTAATSAAARRDRFLAEVALADDETLRGRGEHFGRALAEHRVEYVPRVVVHELEKTFV